MKFHEIKNEKINKNIKPPVKLLFLKAIKQELGLLISNDLI